MDSITMLFNPYLDEMISKNQSKVVFNNANNTSSVSQKKTNYELKQSKKAWYIDVNALYAREDLHRVMETTFFTSSKQVNAW